MELQPLLFMSSCFLTLSGLTFGDQSEGPVIVKEGDDAILPCSLGTNENSVHVRFVWTKEGTEKKVYIHDTGMDYSPALPGRISHFPDDLQHGNASIRIHNVQLEDGGIYTCDFPTRGKTFRIELVVEGPVIVREGDDAILPCSLGTSIVHVRFEWTKEGTEEKVYIRDTGVGYSPALPGRVSHFRDDLQHGNASIRINNVQLKDGGIYTCNFPSREKTFRIKLVVGSVLKARNVPGAAELYITILDQRNGGVLLQCDVKNAHPKPTVDWWDSNDQIIHSEEPQESEQGGRFNITLKSTVKKNGRYRCVATQKEINHRAQKEISVDLNEGPVPVKEGDDAILPCSLGTNESIEFVRFDWKKEGTEKEVYIRDNSVGYSPALPGRVSHFPDDLKNGNASIRIHNVQLKDGGNYTCDFPSRRKTFRIKLVVGAAELDITILDQRNGWVLLQCDVKNAYPKPTVEWWDSNNQIIPSEEPQVSEQGGRFNIALKATVEKNDHYRCVATQKKINHEAQKEIYVYIYEKSDSAQVLPVWAAILIGVLVAVVKV